MMATGGSKPRKRRSAKTTRINPDDLGDVVRAERERAPDEKVQVTVGGSRMRSDAEYVLLFARNLLRVLKHAEGLQANDIRIYLAYVDAASWGNAVSISQRDIADYLDLHESTVCRAVRRLLDAGLLIKRGRSTFLNLTIVLRGRIAATRHEYHDQMVTSVEEMRKRYGPLITSPLQLPRTEDQLGEYRDEEREARYRVWVLEGKDED